MYIYLDIYMVHPPKKSLPFFCVYRYLQCFNNSLANLFDWPSPGVLTQPLRAPEKTQLFLSSGMILQKHSFMNHSYYRYNSIL